MQNSITMGQYLPARSPLHLLDPRAKLLALAFLGLAILINQSWWIGLGITVLVAVCVAVSGIAVAIYWRSLKILWLLLALGALLQVLFTPGLIIWSWGVVKITHQGLTAGGLLLWRLAVLLLLTQLLTFTTTPLQLTRGLEWVLTPGIKLRLPVRELAMMVSLALKFVPTIFSEARLLLLAQKSRGMDLTKGSIKKRLQGLIPFLVPLAANIFRQADLQALALEVRGYQVGQARTSMYSMVFGPADYAAAALTLLILLLALAQRLV